MMSRLTLIVLTVCGLFVPAVHPKLKQEVLDDKVKQLTSWSDRRPVIRMTGDKFINYVRGKPKNYSMVILFTALQSKHGCAVCRDAGDEFSIVANSYRFSQSYSSKLFFGLVDYDDGSDIFQMMKLNSAPVFMHFPAKGRRKPIDTYDIQRLGYQAENLAKWIMERTDVTIKIYRPPSYAGPVSLGIMVFLAGGMLYLKRDSLEFMYNRMMWGTMSVFTVLFMTSGQMWNHIRGAPLMQRNPHTGALQYIHGGSQGQYLVETYIVMFVSSGIAIGFIALNEAARHKRDIAYRRTAGMIGVGLVAVFFSLLLSIFRRKYQGYPYSFLLR